MPVPCKKKKEKKGSRLRAESPLRLFSFLGLLGWNRPAFSSFPSLFFFIFSSQSLTSGPRLSVSPRSGAASIRSSAVTGVCVRPCVQRRLATPRTRRCGVGAATTGQRRVGVAVRGDNGGGARASGEQGLCLGCGMHARGLGRVKGGLGRSRAHARQQGGGAAMAVW